MFPFLFALFLSAAQPPVLTMDCQGPPVYHCTHWTAPVDDGGVCDTWEGTVSECSWLVSEQDFGCHCYEGGHGSPYVEIPCPFNECLTGHCKNCQLEKPAPPTNDTWGKVKGLYRQ